VGPGRNEMAGGVEDLEAAAGRFGSGHVSAFDVRPEFVSGDVAWCHEVERGQAMLGGRSELEDFALRVTSLYRREDGQWRIVLRHADPIVVPRPPDATLA
jgi:ketosteroid isomerase-like protein